MFQDPVLIRHYQRLTDSLAELVYRGYRPEELYLFTNGYLTALRYSHGFEVEGYQINRLEEEIGRFIRDPSSFMPEMMPIPELESR